jgi:hypothetical protein
MKAIRILKGFLVVLGLGLLGSAAWAQCAPGGQFIEQQGQGVTYGICTYPSGNYYTHGANETPVPTGSGSSGGSGSARPQPPKVINRYGAVAWNNKTGGFDSAYNEDSRVKAEASALKKCGVGCIVVSSYSNQCVAIGFGSLKKGRGGYRGVATNLIPKVAESKAFASCNAKANNCQIILSECSKYN